MKTYTEKQKDIIKASLKIISQKGIDYFTTTLLAESINVTEGALYRHFKNKVEIIEGVVDFIQFRFAELVEAMKAPCDFYLERLKEIFIDHCKIVINNPEQMMILKSYTLFIANTTLNKRVNDSIDLYKQTIINIITMAQKRNEIRPEPEPEHIFMMIIGTLHLYLGKWMRREGGFDLIDDGEALWNTLEQYLTANFA